jgi:hypothetical protein
MRGIGKFNEREATDPAGFAVEGNEDARNWPRLGEVIRQLDFRRVVREITDEEPTSHPAALASRLSTLIGTLAALPSCDHIPNVSSFGAILT